MDRELYRLGFGMLLPAGKDLAKSLFDHRGDGTVCLRSVALQLSEQSIIDPDRRPHAMEAYLLYDNMSKPMGPESDAERRRRR
jgi:hypothetical protein